MTCYQDDNTTPHQYENTTFWYDDGEDDCDYDECDAYGDFGLNGRGGGGGGFSSSNRGGVTRQKTIKRQELRGGGGRGHCYSTRHIRVYEALKENGRLKQKQNGGNGKKKQRK